MSEIKQRLVAEFEKNSMEKVRVYLQEFHGQTYCDIRAWIAERAGQEGGEFATKKGITLAGELLPELRSAIDAAISVLNGDGGEK
jgi:hypothetical protein